MTRYVWTDAGWAEAHAVRAAARGVAIQRDFAEPLFCHADGKLHSSRSTYDAAVRAAGCEIIGKAEARKLAASPYRGAPGLEPVGATLKRILNGG